MKVSMKKKGDFFKTTSWLEQLKNLHAENAMNRIGDDMVNALKEASPVRTGELRNSWTKHVARSDSMISVAVTNNAHSDEVDDLVYLIEYGHGTGTGGYVPPNPFVEGTIDKIKPKIDEEIEVLIKNVK